MFITVFEWIYFLPMQQIGLKMVRCYKDNWIIWIWRYPILTCCSWNFFNQNFRLYLFQYFDLKSRFIRVRALDAEFFRHNYLYIDWWTHQLEKMVSCLLFDLKTHYFSDYWISSKRSSNLIFQVLESYDFFPISQLSNCHQSFTDIHLSTCCLSHLALNQQSFIGYLALFT